jgi:hypothetical protein
MPVFAVGDPALLVVGADGALGGLLSDHLGGRRLAFRCPEGVPSHPLGDVHDARVVVNASGPRVRPGLRWSDYHREHVQGSLAVARAMRAGAHLVHFSSAAVYGGRRAGIVGQDTPEAPLSFPNPDYACAKLAAEMAVRATCHDRGVGLSVLRPPLVYGPGILSAVSGLRRLSRRPLRLSLRPASLRQHLLHASLLKAGLEALVTGGPRCPEPLLLADPFVLTNADLSRPPARSRGAGLALAVPLDWATALVRRWPGHPARSAPGVLAALAALGIDLELDGRPTLARLGLRPEDFSRDKTFDRYWSEG